MLSDAPADRPRRRRADGELSRTRILDAASEIAAERGYTGTTIGAVSARCGLPASSIYWHFKHKDDLLVAVIERSFETWLDAWKIPDEGSAQQRARALAVEIGRTLLDAPDVIRLGLMLTLDRGSGEPRARARFLALRQQAYYLICRAVRELVPGLSLTQIRELATYTLAGADGLFLAKEIGGDTVDVVSLFDIHARAIYQAAVRMASDTDIKDIA